ncbi:MAG: AraC family transcriptional regulator [Pseudomonadota bacterium]
MSDTCGVGIVTQRCIGPLQVSHVIAERTRTLRWTPATISRSARPRFVLIRMRAGHGWLHHRGGEVPVCAGECLLLDERDPYELAFVDGSESLWFHLPIDWVEGCLADTEVAVAVPLGIRQPCAGILRDVMDTIHADDGTSPPLFIARSLCTALALTVDSIEVRSTAHSRKTFKSLQRTLAELASTCNVTVAEIAQAHGISSRYLHAIYSANGTSCGRELIRVRLERAQRLLIDPEHRRSIDDIAWQCGFSDAGHFRRRFRALFGVSPSAMRTA